CGGSIESLVRTELKGAVAPAAARSTDVDRVEQLAAVDVELEDRARCAQPPDLAVSIGGQRANVLGARLGNTVPHYLACLEVPDDDAVFAVCRIPAQVVSRGSADAIAVSACEGRDRMAWQG